VLCELRNGDPFVRRHIELEVTAPLELREVDVWVLGLVGPCSHQGFGEPVFLEDLFVGLEFPAGSNTWADGRVTLRQYPGRRVAERFVSKTAVLGVAEAGAVARRFQEYVSGFQATPAGTDLFVNYNTWWTLMPPTEENCLALIRLFREKLYEPFGESFDTFTIDDGWDNKDSLWQLREDRFPRGFAPLVEALAGMKANLGLWLSPSSGYNHAPWGGTHGYEQNSNPWFLCQSGPTYRRDITRVVIGLASTYSLAFYKFDGFAASCDAAGHGHLPGPYAVEANTDAFVELLAAVRQTRPGIYLDPTCGIWLSPWWLRYADSLWGSVSGDYPDAIVPAATVRESATTTRDGVFRQRCLEHPGYPPAAIEHLGIIVISNEPWEEDAMAVVGRGCRLLTLYTNPACFARGDRDWAFLASLLKWVRHNAGTLKRTALVGGDPFQRQAYGFAHVASGGGIVSLRNPFVEPQTLTFGLDEGAGWSRAGAAPGGYVVRVIYPRQETLDRVFAYGDTLALPLQAYEQVALRLEPLSPGAPVLLGVRHQLVERGERRLAYTVHGRPGSTLTPALPATLAPARVLLDGEPATLRQDTEGRVRLPITFPGERGVGAVEAEPFAAGTTADQCRFAGRMVLTVPADTAAAIHLLCNPGPGTKAPVVCTATVGGQPVEVRTLEGLKETSASHLPHSWTWFEFAVPPGRSEVALALTPKEGPYLRAEVGCWLWLEHPLRQRRLELEFGEALPPAAPDPLPLPLAQDREREVLTVLARQSVRLGSRWGQADQGNVWLETVAPDEVTQEWGSLQTGRSVWEKEMTIAGRTFTHGLGTHANGRLVFDLEGGRFRGFRCLVGRDEHAQDGRIVFRVVADGRTVFESGSMTRGTAAQSVEVDLAGAKVLELTTSDGGDGISGDHGNWADAELVR
jgi:hypothetical protein